MSLRLHLFVLLILLLSLLSIFGRNAAAARDTHKPLHRLDQQDIPLFYDDMDFDSLIESAKHQAAYLEKQAPGKKIRFADNQYDNRWLQLSVKELLSKLQQNPGRKELYHFLRENYLVYQAGGRIGKGSRSMLVTGYYEPVFSGSLTRDPHFDTPIYSPPRSLVTLRNSKKTRIGRYDRDNRFVDFWPPTDIQIS